jgi:hypothetical protein
MFLIPKGENVKQYAQEKADEYIDNQQWTDFYSNFVKTVKKIHFQVSTVQPIDITLSKVP